MLEVACNDQLPVAAARAGQLEAWDDLFRRYQMPLYVYVVELVHDQQTSLDIVQETFINAVRYLHTLENDGKFGAWLFRIAHQKCVQYWRRPIRETPLDAHEDPEWHQDEPDPSETLIRKEREEEFMQKVNSLSEAHRAVLLLHYLEDFPLEEIATITATNLGTVKSRMHYAKKTLKRLLEAEL